MTRSQINKEVKAQFTSYEGINLDNECFEEAMIAIKDSEIDSEIEAWLSDPMNKKDINYSDIFKDFYGFRPRW